MVDEVIREIPAVRFRPSTAANDGSMAELRKTPDLVESVGTAWATARYSARSEADPGKKLGQIRGLALECE